MSRDVLLEATRALKAQPVSDGEFVARRTRDRVMASLGGERRRRRRGLSWIPLAAILIGSTAWASGVLPEAWRMLAAAPAPERRERVEAIEVAQRGRETRPSLFVAPPDENPPDGKPGEEPEPEEEPDPVAAAASAAPPAPSAERSPVADASGAALELDDPSTDPSAALYRAAHTAHFAQNDPALALQRWNAYLAAAPRGRFVPEALYNRALCLVRLGRRDAALAALAPFAAGAHGRYRQAEAERLVAALSGE